MKTASDELFLLIKSLTKQEKIFFKAYSINKGGVYKDCSYLKLYKAIEKLKVYDENDLKKRLKRVGYKHNLGKAKNYLSKAIFISLSEYYSDVSISGQIQAFLLQAELLFERRLNKTANKLLHKAEMLAIKHERFDLLLQVVHLKVIAVNQSNSLDGIKSFMEAEAPKEKKYLELLINSIDYRNKALQAYYLSNKFEKNEDQLKEILNDRLFKDRRNALAFSSLKHYYFVHFAIAHKNDKWNSRSFALQNDWIEYLERANKEVLISPSTYLISLSRLIVTQFKTKRISEAENLFKKGVAFYFTLPSKVRNADIDSHFTGFLGNYMMGQLELINPEKAIQAWEMVNKTNSFEQLRPGLKMVLYINSYFSYFLLNKYHDAINCLTKIISGNTSYRMDIQSESRLYLLICHFELENFELLSYLSKSSESWLKKNKLYGNFQKNVIRFFMNHFSNEMSIKYTRQIFSQLKMEIIGMKEATESFDFLSWIESKIEGRPLIAIFREKKSRRK